LVVDTGVGEKIVAFGCSVVIVAADIIPDFNLCGSQWSNRQGFRHLHKESIKYS